MSLASSIYVHVQVHVHNIIQLHIHVHIQCHNWVSQSDPRTNHVYEKITVPMYVCMYVAIRRPRVRHTCACATCTIIMLLGIDR